MKQFIPEVKKNAAPTTARDVGNIVFIGAFVPITIWLLCDLCGLAWVPKEVAGSFGTILGYTFARKFRY